MKIEFLKFKMIAKVSFYDYQLHGMITQRRVLTLTSNIFRIPRRRACEYRIVLETDQFGSFTAQSLLCLQGYIPLRFQAHSRHNLQSWLVLGMCLLVLVQRSASYSAPLYLICNPKLYNSFSQVHFYLCKDIQFYFSGSILRYMFIHSYICHGDLPARGDWSLEQPKQIQCE